MTTKKLAIIFIFSFNLNFSVFAYDQGPQTSFHIYYNTNYTSNEITKPWTLGMGLGSAALLCASYYWGIDSKFFMNLFGAGAVYFNFLRTRPSVVERHHQEIPYLDIAFKTTLDNNLLWEASVEFRSSGFALAQFRDSIEKDRPYKSQVRVNYLDYQNKNLSYINTEGLIFSHAAPEYSGEILTGVIKESISLQELFEALEEMTQETQYYNQSGKNTTPNIKILNPATFTLRLLNKFLNLNKTGLGKYLNEYNSDNPATRDLILEELSHELKKSHINLNTH